MINTKFMAFAKTPELSPLKTRLARIKGAPFAEEFYRLSVACTAEVLTQLRAKHFGVEVQWLLAEQKADNHPFWQKPELGLGPAQFQAEGGLGERLDSAFKNNFLPGSGLGILGTDLPQLSVSLLERALIALSTSADVVIGPARDGGFYLLVTRVPIKTEIWKKVIYSTKSTCEQLIAQLNPLGRVELLETLTDIDEERDLQWAIAELTLLREREGLLPSQTLLLEFLLRSA